MKNLTFITTIILFSFSHLLYAGGYIMTSPKDTYWHPTTTPSKYVKVFPKEFNPFLVGLTSEKANVSIANGVATTKITQTFHNSSKEEMLKGYFLMPAPAGVKAEDFTIKLNGKKVRTEQIYAEKVNKVYEDMIRRTGDVRFLQYGKQDLYKVRIDSMLPNKSQQLSITYRQTLPKDNSTFAYTYPSSTQQFYKSVGKFDLNILVKDGEEIKNVYMPTVSADYEQSQDKELKVTLSQKNNKLEEDFTFFYTTSKHELGCQLFTYKEKEEDGFFLLSFDEGLEKDQSIAPKDVTFVVDASDFMSGAKLSSVKKALNTCIAKLNSNDNFNIVSFSDDANALFDELSQATAENQAKAKTFIEGLEASGETNIEEALELALEASSNPNRPHNLFFISAGEPTVGEDDEDNLGDLIQYKRSANTHFFAFGIGEEANTYLLDMMAVKNKGQRFYIADEKDIVGKITDLYEKISSPILNKIQLRLGATVQVSEVYPDFKSISALYKDAPVTFVGRYKTGGASNISVIGDLNNEMRRFRYDLDFTKDDQTHTFVPQIWASRKIGRLFDEMRLDVEDSQTIKEIITLAKKHAVVNPYTAYLITQAEAVKKMTRAAIHDQANYKWDYDVLMEDVSGKASMLCSEEIQQLSMASCVEHTAQGQARMALKDTEGKVLDKNVQAQYAVIQGRGIYQTATSMWIDADAAQATKAKYITFASEDYFKLLHEKPEVIEFMALGRDVQFNTAGTTYKITTGTDTGGITAEKLDAGTDAKPKTSKKISPPKVEDLEEGKMNKGGEEEADKAPSQPEKAKDAMNGVGMNK